MEKDGKQTYIIEKSETPNERVRLSEYLALWYAQFLLLFQLHQGYADDSSISRKFYIGSP